MSEQELREMVVREAMEWCGTPFQYGQCLKGVACDCATFLIGVLSACGVIEYFQRDNFGRDWWTNAKTEEYLFRVMRRAVPLVEGISYPTLTAAPGNIALTRAAESKVFNHAGIVYRWPHVVHAVTPIVCRVNASTHGMWANRTVAIFDPFRKAAA